MNGDSLDDLTMWNQFVLYAIETHSQKFSESYQIEGNVKFSCSPVLNPDSFQNTSYFLFSNEIHRVSEFLRPLAQRTLFVRGKFDNPFTVFHSMDHNGNVSNQSVY